MPSSDQIITAMDEWLSTKGLTDPETKMIEELKRIAVKGEDAFFATCNFFATAMKTEVIGAVKKAREQGKCQCWPD